MKINHILVVSEAQKLGLCLHVGLTSMNGTWNLGPHVNLLLDQLYHRLGAINEYPIKEAN